MLPATNAMGCAVVPLVCIMSGCKSGTVETFGKIRLPWCPVFLLAMMPRSITKILVHGFECILHNSATFADSSCARVVSPPLPSLLSGLIVSRKIPQQKEKRCRGIGIRSPVQSDRPERWGMCI